jgi:REP element-mobilizing transposase RayT
MDTPQPSRRSIRLPLFDYSTHGAYFVTICVHQKKCMFGEIEDGEMRLNEVGEMIKNTWLEIPNHFESVELDVYAILPNHFHGILWIIPIINQPIVGAPDMFGQGQALPLVGAPLVGARTNQPIVGAPLVGARSNIRVGTRPTPTLGDVVGAFKSITSVEYFRMLKNNQTIILNTKLWQRNYYEHIIRDDNDLEKIQKYVLENPLKWEFDHENLSGRAPETNPPIVGAPHACPVG